MGDTAQEPTPKKQKVEDMKPEVKRCIEAFKANKPVMIFDSEWREGETDLLWHGTAAQPECMRQLRKDACGLLFLAIGDDVGERYGLPFLQDLHTTESLIKEHQVLGKLQTNDLQYDSRSAFTLSINHRNTYTGITDKDRALTTRRFAELYEELVAGNKTQEESMTALGKEFRTPGHIPMCRESKGGLSNRRGHTELAVSVARLAGLSPVVIGAEMLDPEGDGALTVAAAREYAKKYDIPMVTGADLLEAHGYVRPTEEEERNQTKPRVAA